MRPSRRRLRPLLKEGCRRQRQPASKEARPGRSPRPSCRRSSRVDHDDFGILDRGDGHDLDILDRRAVARAESHAVDLDRAAGRHQIAVAAGAEPVFGASAGLQRGAQHPGIGADRQRIGVVRGRWRASTKRPERSAFGNGLAPQRRRAAAPGRAGSRSGRASSARLPGCTRRGGCRCRRSSPGRRRPRCGPSLPRLSWWVIAPSRT